MIADINVIHPAAEVVDGPAQDMPDERLKAATATQDLGANTVKWILDTGASNHMMDERQVKKASLFESNQYLNVKTAAGNTRTRTRACFYVQSIDELLEGIILPGCPPALSVGRLRSIWVQVRLDRHLPCVH